ncbi:MAG: hypothetical protein OEW39_09135 [Deltaproteobacteria bacterium]|nr:hypothetical protein [Deltaproteobacteria bacterium]
MTGWQWFWTLVGFVAYVLALMFLYFYEPIRVLFMRVAYGIQFNNIVLWVSAITGIIGLVGYHWHAYRVHIVHGNSMDLMILTSLKGTIFAAIVLSGGATLQAAQDLGIFIIGNGQVIHADFGGHLVSVFLLTFLTALFYFVYWIVTHIPIGQNTSPVQELRAAPKKSFS